MPIESRPSAPAAPERVSHASVARRVTLFEDRAEVVRTAVVPVVPGAQWVSLSGVTPYLDDRSLQVRAEGAGTVLGARVVRRVVQESSGNAGDGPRLEVDLRAAQRRGQVAGLDLARAGASTQRIDQLFSQWTEGLAEVPAGVGAEGGSDEWRAAFDALAADHAIAREAVQLALDVQEESLEDAGRTQERLELARLLRPRYETLIEVQVHSEAAQALGLEVTYRTPCALWRPEHLARLTPTAAGKGDVELVTDGVAWQATGEDWSNVLVRFSTARPAQHAEAPLLSTEKLQLQRKGEEEKKSIVIEVREQTIASAGLGRGVKAVEEMPGVDDGGEPLAWEPAQRVTLASDARAFRVELSRVRLEAAVARVAFPERSQALHVRATMTLTSPRPLLAGPVRVARGSAFVGRARLNFVGAGEPFELGFGIDDGVRVRREQTDERDTALITGTQKLKRTVRLFLSNLSGESRDLVVNERVPVSEIEDVSVALVDAKTWTFDAKDGFARQAVVLAPHATRRLELIYELRASAKVVLPVF